MILVRSMRFSKHSILLIAIIMSLFLVGNVAAVVGNYKTVPKGGSVFVGEEGLDISGSLNGYTHIAWKEKSDSVPYSLYVGDGTNFYVNPNEFTSKTGNWFLYDATTGTVLTDVVFNVKQPIVIIRPIDAAGESLIGKSVPRDAKIDFRIETNLNEIYARDGGLPQDFPFNIKVESPSGVVYTKLYTSSTTTGNLLDLPITSGNPIKWSSLSGGMWDVSIRDGAGYRYPSGKYYVSAECNVNSLKDNNIRAKSDSVYFTIATDVLSIETNKETISRGSQFVVTVTGVPSETYTLFVKSGVAGESPKIIDNQDGVTKTNDFTATIKTTSSGTRTIGFSTDVNTKAKRWTIRVEKGDKSDEVVIDVKAGKVTLTVEGSGVYFLGDEIKLVGTNSETDTVYFFITGPNLPSAGGKLTEPRSPAGFVSATVKEDNTFEYKWDTNNLAIDAGSYTIYAVSEAKNKDNLADASYDTVSVSFRKPFITVSITPSNIAAGDKFHIKGNAGVETTSGVAIWIMGKNYFKRDVVSVESDGSFDFEVKGGTTEGLAVGQYFVVVQHPMYNGEFDVYEGTGSNTGYVVGNYPVANQENRKFKWSGAGALQGSDAANALVDAIDDSAIDDSYARANFMISQPTITIKPIGTVTIGNKFFVEGTTNLAIGNTIIVEVVSASFGPTKKTASGEFSGFSGSVKVVEGTGEWNSFKIEVPSSNFIKDEYIVTATSVETTTSGSINFQVVETPPTPTHTPIPPTPEPTPIPPTIPPTPPPTPEVTIIQPTPTPTIPPTPEETPATKSPGFGAIIAVIGLGVAGYMIVYGKKDN